MEKVRQAPDFFLYPETGGTGKILVPPVVLDIKNCGPLRRAARRQDRDSAVFLQIVHGELDVDAGAGPEHGFIHIEGGVVVDILRPARRVPEA